MSRNASSDDSSTTVVEESSGDTSEKEWALLRDEEFRIKKLVSARQRTRDKEALRERIRKLNAKLEDLDSPAPAPANELDPGRQDGGDKTAHLATPSGAECAELLDKREAREREGGRTVYDRDRGHYRRGYDEVEVSNAPYHHIIAPQKSEKMAVKVIEPIVLIKINGIYRIKHYQFDGSSDNYLSD